MYVSKFFIFLLCRWITGSFVQRSQLLADHLQDQVRLKKAWHAYMYKTNCHHLQEKCCNQEIDDISVAFVHAVCQETRHILARRLCCCLSEMGLGVGRGSFQLSALKSFSGSKHLVLKNSHKVRTGMITGGPTDWYGRRLLLRYLLFLLPCQELDGTYSTENYD